MNHTKARSPLASTEGRLSEHLPWMVHVSPDLILTKDGSLLAAFEMRGVDVDEDSVYKLQTAINEMQSSVQVLDDKYYVWMVTDKRLKQRPDEFEHLSTNPLVELIESRLHKQYENRKVFTLSTYVFILFTGETGVYRFMENVKQKMADDGTSLWKAVLYGMNPANTQRSAILHDAKQLDANIELAESGVSAFIHAHTEVSFRRLAGWDLDSLLLRMANPTLGKDAHVELVPSVLLDAALASSDIKFGREIYAIQGPNRTLYGHALSLNGYPANAHAFSTLLRIEEEFRLVHVLRCLSLDASRKAVQEHADYYRISQSTLSQRVVAYLNNKDAEVDPGQADLYAQCVEALRRNNSENLGFAYHSVSVHFYGETPEHAQHVATEVLNRIGGLPNIRERLGLKSAVLSTLPGQWAHNQRLMLANTQIISNVAPLSYIDPGSPESVHLSEVYNRPMPALATFLSRFGTEVYFDPFVKQVGHSILFIPTGGGKTTFVNYCLTCFSRYPDAQVIIFDRDHSCRIVTHLVGGKHVDMRTGMSFNPLAHIRESEMEMIQAREFIIRRVEEGGETLTAEQRNEIYQKLKQVAESTQELSLNTLYHLLSTPIQIKLNEWVHGGPFSYFGESEDKLELDNWTCIEMKEIMKVDRLSRAFLDHAFSSIARKLTGKPTFIYVEEASFALSNPAFLKGIDEWLKTFRKKNAVVWLTVQSPESITEVNVESIRATLTDNVPNILLGANPRLESHRALYKSMFGLSDDQISMVRGLRAQRDYLRIAGSICRVMGTEFDEHVLAAIRSEPHFQQLLDKMMASGDPDWRNAYLKHAVERQKNVKKR